MPPAAQRDEQKYAREFDKIRAAFQKQFVHDDGFVAGADNAPSPFGEINNPDAKSNGGDTQTGYVLALHMNLLPRISAQPPQKSSPTKSRPTTACSAPAFWELPICSRN